MGKDPVEYRERFRGKGFRWNEDYFEKLMVHKASGVILKAVSSEGVPNACTKHCFFDNLGCCPDCDKIMWVPLECADACS